MENEEKIRRLGKMIREAERVVFFGGAGVSTESGLPDFRSPKGAAAKKYAYPFEVILSHEFFYDHTEEFFDYYFAEMARDGVRPNAAHFAVAELERKGRLTAVVTQNVDGLHQAAGSRNVFELHGSVHRNTCTVCGAKYTLGDMLARRPVPRCRCGGLIKTDVVLYGEQLPDDAVSGAVRALEAADLVIVAGTSLAVYPAASFLHYTRGRIALVNLTHVASPVSPDLEINDSAGRVLSAAVAEAGL